MHITKLPVQSRLHLKGLSIQLNISGRDIGVSVAGYCAMQAAKVQSDSVDALGTCRITLISAFLSHLVR